ESGSEVASARGEDVRASEDRRRTPGPCHRRVIRAMTDLVVIGAGPAGVLAALLASDLGARTVLVTSGAFGGMAADNGPVPVRTLAHAARLIRDGRQLARYGITIRDPAFDYPRLL